MLVTIGLFVVGLYLLVKGADWLVDGSSSIAMHFRVKPFVIGLTLVAFGTSVPEFVVSIIAALQNNRGIILGNVIGSNMLNTIMVPGVLALMVPLRLHINTIVKEIPMAFLGAFILAVVGFQYILDGKVPTSLLFTHEAIGTIKMSDGIILLCFFIVFVYYVVGMAFDTKGTKDFGTDIKQIPFWKAFLLLVTGLIMLLSGGQLTVDNAVKLAYMFGLSGSFIGLTLIAIGTSLPELIGGVVAIRKQHTDLAIGNLVGSNIFNIFFIVGITSIIRPIVITGQNMMEILFLLVSTVVVLLCMFIPKENQIGKTKGIVLLSIYITFIIYVYIHA